ncbi:hypothetical protein DAI22_03g044401 [Oryza sativa Japonica Group]|nr:hypothetical protein DAI22_03g044401 [Oryza sativa Japonica Group]
MQTIKLYGRPGAFPPPIPRRRSRPVLSNRSAAACASILLESVQPSLQSLAADRSSSRRQSRSDGYGGGGSTTLPSVEEGHRCLHRHRRRCLPALQAGITYARSTVISFDSKLLQLCCTEKLHLFFRSVLCRIMS